MKLENNPMGAPNEELISKNELAHRLNKTVRTISNWQRRGIVPYVKCRRAVFYDWNVVRAHLDRHFHLCGKKPFLISNSPRQAPNS
jgi:hypothetical protein